MTDLMKIVLLLSVSGTALAAALALLRRILKEKLPKAVFYYLWLLVLLRLIVPVALPVPGLELAMESPKMEVTAPPTVENRPSDVVQTPVQVNPPATQTAPSVIITDGNGQTQAEPPQTPWYEDAWTFLCEHFTPIWLTGAALHFLWFAVSYFRFCRSLKQDCAPLLEHEQALLDNLRGEVRVAACRSPLARTPMLLGLIRPRIVLPDAAITTRELECILRHELTHLGRRDLLYKWFTVAVTSVHWFNPLMPWLRKEISRACELSCDEGVIRVMDDEHKRLYGETLLALAAANALPRAVPATTLCEEKKQLKERLLGIKKYKKATLLMVLLSVALALLVAGCAAVLGPQMQKNTFTGPLSEEQQAPVLENIKAWAEKNIEVDGEITVTYSEPNDQPQSLGWLAELSQECYLYDLHTGRIGPVDGTYPDTADLGRVLVQGKVNDYNRMWTFYLTNGDPAKAVDPIQGLEEMAANYPDAKVGELRWFRMEGKGIYIAVDFETGNGCSLWQYSSVCGQWGVTPREAGKGSPGVVPLDKLPGLMAAVVSWQETHADEYDRINYSLNLNTTILARMNQSGSARDFLSSNWTNIVVYDLTTGEMENRGREYTGTCEYGHLTLLYPAKTVQEWVYVIDESEESDPKPTQPEQDTALTGQVAVLTQNAPLENAFVQTVDTEGRTVVMDMAMALKKGDLVYVESQDGETCNVTVLAGEPPRPQGQLDESILATDIGSLQEANQVILKDAKMWHGDPNEGVFSDAACTGVANVEKRKTVTRDTWSPEGTVQTQEHWLQVTLPGGGDPFWVRQEDVAFLWPLSEPAPDLSGKVFVYEKEGFGGKFTISLQDDGTFSYYEGLLSSHLGWGTWTVEGDTLTLREDTFSRVFHFRIEDDSLYYIKKSSSPFTYVQLGDNARFLEDTQPSTTEIPSLYDKTAAWLEQEFHRVYDPWYDIQSLTISDWQESGNEATFHYKKEYLYYNRDPDTVPYILEAKARSQSSYERLYQDYLALKESNYSFKIVWNEDKPTLYSDVSVKGVPEWQPVKIDDYILPWEDPEDSRKIFGEILWNAYLKGELYDGSKLDWTSTEGAAENHFAVTDIDGDGREELLLSWTNASTAGHCFVIYGCWRGAVYTQFTGFPSLRFYDNAAIEEDWSHNQGWSGRFWPHYAYRYNPQSDLYEQVGFVEGWDKQLQPEGFPVDLDADGDGLVYDVRPADFDWTGSRYAPERMMDGPAFEEWRQTYLNGAQQVELELLPLTEENIAALGAPKPNVPEVKPVG